MSAGSVDRGDRFLPGSRSCTASRFLARSAKPILGFGAGGEVATSAGQWKLRDRSYQLAFVYRFAVSRAVHQVNRSLRRQQLFGATRVPRPAASSEGG